MKRLSAFLVVVPLAVLACERNNRGSVANGGTGGEALTVKMID